MVDVLILTGPCGVGKSSVAFECMNLLEAAGVPAAMVDGELAYFHPKAANDRFGYDVAEAGLRALWPVYAQAGHTRLLLPRVVEDEEQYAIVERAVRGARIRVLRLVAGSGTIEERLRARELGSGLAWHLERSAAIRRATIGDSVDAERSVSEVARDVLARAGWLPQRV
jgi:hypothetical protein